jgi:hypothetical protein
MFMKERRKEGRKESRDRDMHILPRIDVLASYLLTFLPSVFNQEEREL